MILLIFSLFAVVVGAPQDGVVPDTNIPLGNPGGLLRSFGEECDGGLVKDYSGNCVMPEVTRNVYVYDAPEQPPVELRTPRVLPKPKVFYNLVFVRSPQPSPLAEPVVLPPPQQKTLIYVLNQSPTNQEQQIIEVPSKHSKPEVYYVSYDDEVNYDLPAGIDLQSALAEANAQKGQFISSENVPNAGKSLFSGSKLTTNSLNSIQVDKVRKTTTQRPTNIVSNIPSIVGAFANAGGSNTDQGFPANTFSVQNNGGFTNQPVILVDGQNAGNSLFVNRNSNPTVARTTPPATTFSPTIRVSSTTPQPTIGSASQSLISQNQRPNNVRNNQRTTTVQNIQRSSNIQNIQRSSNVQNQKNIGPIDFNSERFTLLDTQTGQSVSNFGIPLSFATSQQGFTPLTTAPISSPTTPSSNPRVGRSFTFGGNTFRMTPGRNLVSLSGLANNRRNDRFARSMFQRRHNSRYRF